MKTINVMAATVAAVIGTSGAYVAGGATVSVTPLNLSLQGETGAATQPAAESDTVKVQGRGVGVTKDAALKDAYRDAVERAVGLYVDADTVADNDEIVTDQILTQSNAYITDFSELGTKQIDGGLVQVRILATVKKQALTTKLTGVMPAQMVRIDNTVLQNVHAQLVTKERRAEDAAALLKHALDGVNPMQSLMVASIRPETLKIITADDTAARSQGSAQYQPVYQQVVVGDSTTTVVGPGAPIVAPMPIPVAGSPGAQQTIVTPDGTVTTTAPDGSQAGAANGVTLRYIFEVKLDRAKYFNEFVPHLKKVLDQISLTKPKEVRLTEVLLPNSNERREFLRKYMELTNPYDTIPDDPHDSHSSMVGMCGSYKGFKSAYFDSVHCYSILWQGENWLWEFCNHKGGYRQKSGGGFLWNGISLQNGDLYENGYKEKVYFALITSLNADCSSGKVTMYELDKSVIPTLNGWRKGLIDKNAYGPEQKTTNYNIILLDRDGEEIGVYPWLIPNGMLMNVKFADFPNAGMVYATPFVGCFGESMIQWRDFAIEKDQLAKIASVKIELVD